MVSPVVGPCFHFHSMLILLAVKELRNKNKNKKVNPLLVEGRASKKKRSNFLNSISFM